MESKHYWVYILRCKDGSLYTGYTTDLEQRVQKHNEGKGAKYTRGRGPVEVVYAQQGNDLSWALSREIEIKKLNRQQKLRLIIREGEGQIESAKKLH
jgi:putative endonuclease